MTDLTQALAALREVPSMIRRADHGEAYVRVLNIAHNRIETLLASLDAARGQAVKGAFLVDGEVRIAASKYMRDVAIRRGALPLYAAPPAAAVLLDGTGYEPSDVVRIVREHEVRRVVAEPSPAAADDEIMAGDCCDQAYRDGREYESKRSERLAAQLHDLSQRHDALIKMVADGRAMQPPAPILVQAPPAAADELSIAAHGKRMYDRGFADALSTAQAPPAAAVRAELLRWANEPTKDRGSEAFDLDSGYELARKHVREMLATQNPPAAAVPEGYALVPVEPTRAMRRAAISEYEDAMDSRLPDGDGYDEEVVARMFNAMLAAAQGVGRE